MNTEQEDEKNLLKMNQLILYPDESHDLANLEIESNIYLATTSTLNINNINTDDIDADQQHANLTGPSTANQMTTITSSTNEQNIATTIQTIKIRLKSADENEQPQQKQNKKTVIEQQQQQPPQPILPQLAEINLNDSHTLVEDEDTGMLTSTEEEIDKEADAPPPPKQNPTTLIAPLNNNKKLNATEKGGKMINNNKKITTTKSNIYRTQFNIDQLKAGLTNKSDLTFIQLYLALNKPTLIKLKYEWQPIKQQTSIDAIQASTANIELIDKQRFYLQVLAKVAESYLSEMKFQHNESLNAAKKLTMNEKVAAATKPMANETTTIAISTAVNEANKTQKLLQDISSKARKLRQKKAIVVKSTRVSCESPTPAIMSPCSVVTTTTSSSSSTSNSNIVLPVAAVARQIVNITSNDGYATTQRKMHITANQQQSTSLIGYQDQQQQMFTLQKNYSNIIPQIFHTFLNDNNNNNSSESGFSSANTNNNCTYSDNSLLNNVILHSNMILNDDVPHINSMQHEQIDHPQQQQILSTDLSLIDISLNNDSVFGLNENSNMSSLSSKLTILSFILTISILFFLC